MQQKETKIYNAKLFGLNFNFLIIAKLSINSTKLIEVMTNNDRSNDLGLFNHKIGIC
jgi:hypothetical protein